MGTFDVRWRLEIDGESKHDAAVQAVADMQERTGTVTVEVRSRDGLQAGPWESVEVEAGTVE